MTTARGGSRGPSTAQADRVAGGVCSQKKVSEDETVQLIDVTFEPRLDGSHESRKFTTFKPLEEQILSQKLSQLSTSANPPPPPPPLEKKNDFDTIPRYLSNENTSFETMIHQALSTTATSNSIEDLREIAILMYRLMSNQYLHSLWSAYSMSGMGQLTSLPNHPPVHQAIHPQVWPVEVKMKAKQNITAETTENEACLALVNRRLQELDGKAKQYRMELDIQKNRCHRYTPTIQQAIRKFVEQGFDGERLRIEHKIHLVQYDYAERVLELEYLAQYPNDEQIKLRKRLYKAKYRQEITDVEVKLVKQRIHYHNLDSSSTFERLPVYQSALLDSIADPTSRQALYDEYRNVAEQAKADMMNLYVSTAEAQMCHYRRQLDVQDSLPQDQGLTQAMRDILRRDRFNIAERVKCIYNFKASVLRSTQMPTNNQR